MNRVPLSAAGRVLLTGASLFCHRNMNEDALLQLKRAQNIAAALDDQDLLAETVQCEAEIAASSGFIEEAIEHFNKAMISYHSQRRSYRFGLCCLGQGRALIRLGEIERARHSLEEAVRLLTDSADHLNLACARMSLAELVSISGEHELALEQLESALKAFEELGNIDKKLQAQAAIIKTLIRLNRIDQAVEYLKQETLSETRHAGSVRSRGRVYAALGKWKEAEESARQAVRLAEESGDTLGQAEARRTLGEIYLSLWFDAEAVEELGAANRCVKQARHLLLELEIKLLLSQAIYLIDKTESMRLMSEVEETIDGRDLLQLEEACNQARKRNSAQQVEHFFVLTGESPLTLKAGNRRLLGWMVLRALQLSERNIPNVAQILKKSSNYLHVLVKRLKRSASVSRGNTR